MAVFPVSVVAEQFYCGVEPPLSAVVYSPLSSSSGDGLHWDGGVWSRVIMAVTPLAERSLVLCGEIPK